MAIWSRSAISIDKILPDRQRDSLSSLLASVSVLGSVTQNNLILDSVDTSTRKHLRLIQLKRQFPGSKRHIPDFPLNTQPSLVSAGVNVICSFAESVPPAIARIMTTETMTMPIRISDMRRAISEFPSFRNE
jgi:hypothetical protein